MSVERARRSQLYLGIQLCGATAKQGPPAHSTNRGGFWELGPPPGLLGVAHGIAHGVAHGIAETHGTTGSIRTRGSRLPRLAPGSLEVTTRIAAHTLRKERRVETIRSASRKEREE